MRRFALIAVFFILVSFFVSGQSIYDLGVPGTNYDISRDNNGNIHLVWVNSDNYKRLFYGRIVNNALTGVETVDLDYKIHIRFTRPRMAVQPNGSTIHVTYISPGPGSYLVHLWRNSSGTWSEDVVWSKGTTKYYMAFPAVGVDASGNVHLVAQRWYGEVQNYIAYWRKTGGSWSSYVSIEPNNSVPWRDVSMFTDLNGGVHATWKTGQLVYGRYRYAANGGSLASSTTINIPKDTGGNMVSFGDSFATSNGDVHHIYMRYGDETLWHTVKRNGSSTFGELSQAGVVNNSEHGGSYAYENPWPAIGVGPDGTPVIAWAENRQSGAVNYVNIAYKEGVDWFPIVADNAARIDSEGRPVIAVVDTTGYLVWRDGEGNLKLMIYTLNEATGVLTPSGGEEWKLGTTHEIIWNLENATGTFDIHLHKNDVDLGPIATGFDDSSNPGSYNWTINTLEDLTPIDSGIDYKIEVKASNGSDSGISDNNFSLIPTLTITAPASGDDWTMGTSQNITWTLNGTQATTVKITLYDETGTNLIHILTLNTPNDGIYEWAVPEGVFPAGNYVVRVKTTDNAVFDNSDVFAISEGAVVTPTITVTSPTTGDDWTTGTTQDITWTTAGSMASTVKITLYNSSGSVWVATMTLNTPNGGSYSWTIPTTIAPGNYVVRVKTTDNAVFDNSDVFTISGGTGDPSITVTSPTTGDDWVTGTTQDITWTTAGSMASTVKITLYNSSGSVWVATMTLNTPNDGSYSWTIPTTIAPGNYVVRVKTTDNAVFDNSDVFAISESSTPLISVTSPAGGVSWAAGTSQTITWAKSGSMSTSVKITLYDPSGKNLLSIITMSTPNDESFNWSIPSNIPAGHYKVRVKTVDNAVSGESDIFLLTGGTQPSIIITSPGFENIWQRNTTKTIIWTKSGTQAADVKITLYDSTGLILIETMTMNTPNDGSYDWNISSGLPLGEYIVRVKTTDNAVYDNSYIVTIAD